MRSVVEWYDLRGRAEWQAVMSGEPLERARGAAIANVMMWLFGRNAADPLEVDPGVLDPEVAKLWEERLKRPGRGPNM